MEVFFSSRFGWRAYQVNRWCRALVRIARTHHFCTNQISSNSIDFGHLNQFNLVHWHKQRKRSLSSSPLSLCERARERACAFDVVHDFFSDRSERIFFLSAGMCYERKCQSNCE